MRRRSPRASCTRQALGTPGRHRGRRRRGGLRARFRTHESPRRQDHVRSQIEPPARRGHPRVDTAQRCVVGGGHAGRSDLGRPTPNRQDRARADLSPASPDGRAGRYPRPARPPARRRSAPRRTPVRPRHRSPAPPPPGSRVEARVPGPRDRWSPIAVPRGRRRARRLPPGEARPRLRRPARRTPPPRRARGRPEERPHTPNPPGPPPTAPRYRRPAAPGPPPPARHWPRRRLRARVWTPPACARVPCRSGAGSAGSARRPRRRRTPRRAPRPRPPTVPRRGAGAPPGRHRLPHRRPAPGVRVPAGAVAERRLRHAAPSGRRGVAARDSRAGTAARSPARAAAKGRLPPCPAPSAAPATPPCLSAGPNVPPLSWRAPNFHRRALPSSLALRGGARPFASRFYRTARHPAGGMTRG